MWQWTVREAPSARREAYRFAVSAPDGTSWPPPEMPDWHLAVASASADWCAWVEGDKTELPGLVAEEWAVEYEHSATPLDELATGRAWRVCQALITLHARSQLIGGTVGGMRMAMFEETITHPGSGRVANATLSDYLVAVSADVPDIDVVSAGEPDPSNPIGAKGIGEVGLVGVAAAIANGVYHATGRRIRSLPITISQLL
jgi:hypothetical protein